MSSCQVSSESPWLFVLLVDGSHSMGADWGSSKRSMADIVEQSVNHLLYDMALNFCVTDHQSESGIKDRIHVKILVYGQEDVVDDLLPSEDGSFTKASGDSGWVRNYSDTYSYPDPNGMTIPIPRWLKLSPGGTTPMLGAFKEAKTVVQEHINAYPESAPPVILNISDGEPTDCGDPIDWSLLEEEFNEILALAKESSRPMVCNVHLGSLADQKSILFPSNQPTVGGLESGLWKISSPVPDNIIGMVEEEYKIGSEEGRRFFVFNSDLIHFHKFLHFSTKNATRPEKVRVVDGANETDVIDVPFEIMEEE